MADRNPSIPGERRMDVEHKAHDQQDYMEDDSTRTFNEQQAKQQKDSSQERMTGHKTSDQTSNQDDTKTSPVEPDAPDNAAPG